MTGARILATPPDGHGFTSKTLDRIYHELTSGRNLGEQFVVVGVVVPSTTSQRRTAKGFKRTVGLEFLRLEPVTDQAGIDEVRHLIETAYANRTGGRQLSLEWEGAPEIEQRREIDEALTEWAATQTPAKSRADVEEMWRDYIGPQDGDRPVAFAKAPTAYQREFALYIGALLDDKVAARPALPAPDELATAIRPVPEAEFLAPGEEATDGSTPEPEDGSVEAAAAEAAEQRAEATEPEPEAEPDAEPADGDGEGDPSVAGLRAVK